MNYEEAIDYLMSFTDMERGFQASSDPAMSLASMRSLLGRLNNPQAGRNTVHITGSKGKGSTAGMLETMLRHAGTNTSLFTSPHLHSYTERIRIAGEAITEGEFATGVTAIQAMVEAEQKAVGGNVSTFGILTALFFWLTRAQLAKIDWQVVEVGLGGTFDTTNVFDEIDVAVITPVSLEHTKILGNTPAEIATDKAGIIKPGALCVLAQQRDSAVIDVVRQRCDDVGAELLYVPDHYEIEPLEQHVFGQSFALHNGGQTRELRTPMLGRHQLDNAATAVAVVDGLRKRGHDIPDGAESEGLARARIGGRMEVMGQSPLVVADGAHNGESAAALAATLRDYFEWKRCFLVLGTLRDKDVGAMAFQLAGLAEMIICTGFDSPRAMDPYVMVQETGFLGPPAVAEPSLSDALDTALSHANADDLVCITGSLYLVAEARALILGESVTG